MSFSNTASYTQHLATHPGYPQQLAYMQPGSSPGHPQPHQPRIVYFITRTNGSIVPLVPVDELPYSLRLEGAPRNMSPDQTFGMQFLGTFPCSGMFFKTKEESSAMQRTSSQPKTPVHHRQYSNGKQYMAPDAHARNAAHQSHNLSITHPAATLPASRAQTNSPSPPGSTAPARPLTDPQAIINAIVSSKSGAETAARVGYIPKSATSTIAPPSGKIPDANKKTHCSYWIRTGECDYAQQGCMYKHEMPDEKGLMELGFRGTPRWWLEKNQAIKLGSGIGGKRPTVGERVKPSAWLRKVSGSETDVESVESKGRDEGGKQLLKAKQAEEKIAQGQENTLTIAKKPSQQTEAATSLANETLTPQPQARATKLTDTGDLIEFESSEPSFSSVFPTVTPPTSTESSPRGSPSTLKTPSSSPICFPPNKSKKKIFIPKGESKPEHLAAHASRQQQRSSSDSISGLPKPSAVQIESLEKQIQRAQKSKHLGGAGGVESAGLMASRHAPAGGAEGRRGGRTATGLRVRRPAPLQCAEIPTNGKRMREKAEAAEGEKEKSKVSSEVKDERKK